MCVVCLVVCLSICVYVCLFDCCLPSSGCSLFCSDPRRSQLRQRVSCHSQSNAELFGARTFLKDGGEQEGTAADAIWIGHLSEWHYMGIRIVPESDRWHGEERMRLLGLIRADCGLCTEAFSCASHATNAASSSTRGLGVVEGKRCRCFSLQNCYLR